jgi:type IV secretion system protein VirB11
MSYDPSAVDAATVATGAAAGAAGARRPDRGAAGGSSESVASALDLTLAPLRAWLTDPEVTEICLNRPGEAFVERGRGWRCERLEFASADWCRRLAKLVANATRQRIDEESPLLSAGLPGGARLQAVMPPATTPGTVAIAIRRPSAHVWSLEELSARGLFAPTRPAAAGLDALERSLSEQLAAGDYPGFLTRAVRARRNILVSGPTGAGKTTVTKALIQEIELAERLITIEDAHELVLDRHPNHVRLYYSKDDQGRARVTPKQLLEACLRMRPDRILLAELRGEEAFDYLRNVNSGHPGSITSVHAGSCELAFEQLVLLVKQSAAGRALARQDIQQLLYRLVDVVVQVGLKDGRRCVLEIDYDPERKHRALAAAR